MASRSISFWHASYRGRKGNYLFKFWATRWIGFWSLLSLKSSIAARSISFWHASYREEKSTIKPNSRPPGGSASGLCHRWSPPWRPGPSASGTPPIWEKRQLLIKFFDARWIAGLSSLPSTNSVLVSQLLGFSCTRQIGGKTKKITVFEFFHKVFLLKGTV